MRVQVRDLPAVKDSVIARIPKADDLEVHVKLTDIDGEKFLNVREYVISRDWYGRGVILPMNDESISLLVGGIYVAADKAGTRVSV